MDLASPSQQRRKAALHRLLVFNGLLALQVVGKSGSYGLGPTFVRSTTSRPLTKDDFVKEWVLNDTDETVQVWWSEDPPLTPCQGYNAITLVPDDETEGREMLYDFLHHVCVKRMDKWIEFDNTTEDWEKYPGHPIRCKQTLGTREHGVHLLLNVSTIIVNGSDLPKWDRFLTPKERHHPMILVMIMTMIGCGEILRPMIRLVASRNGEEDNSQTARTISVQTIQTTYIHQMKRSHGIK
eukprot:gnl/MRDRNA2_/MRDRNA2_64243_c0_seq2.p1 gnl/MRDRNA2_/MRDRNA2_64243_c0~~gnl/MRDRNA2_/MRDRNA2_64243_c0_seq2.p1  ORF type:complete len:239 (+),score=31.65 gnl/MRDRNA2_/MRDRNA2_64243_c0_seq2:132-848(+)